MSKTTPRPPAAVLPETLHPEQRLSTREVCALLGLGRTTVYRLIRLGRLPAPEKMGLRVARWRAGDVLEVLRQRAEG